MKEKSGVLLSDQMKRFAAIKCPARVTFEKLAGFLKETAGAEIKQTTLAGGESIFAFLCPVKSDATRYLIFEHQNWSYVAANCRGEFPESQAYAVSRYARCDAIVVSLHEHDRRVYFYKKGASIRQIQSGNDGRCYYYEDGEPLTFEDPAERLRRYNRDRLKPQIVENYFRLYTGADLPNWKQLPQKQVYAFEVTYPFREDPPIEYPTIRDFP